MTYAVQGALQKAVELAKENENQNIEIEAVLKAALEENESLFKSVLERANIDTEQLVNAYNEKLKNYPNKAMISSQLLSIFNSWALTLFSFSTTSLARSLSMFSRASRVLFNCDRTIFHITSVSVFKI